MNSHLQILFDFISQSEALLEADRQHLLGALKKVDNELTISLFKLDRTEKVKRTTAILLEETIEELEQKRKAVEEALAELKATQAQLIHSEKMASLGELTAGIAHEIQNPLNFVNNFSEVSKELLEELTQEIEKGDWEEVKALAGDVIQNLEKINHHGKRADGIVKGMLQHSRSSDGKKEPADLNTLVDEYLRLAYHGMRAKNKAFNAHLETDFGEAVGEVTLVPQDIGRVVLNLLTNAFHAVDEKKELAPEGYQPKVRVQTRKAGKYIEIRVADNGKGMPEPVKAKIFQPFFTTKPTGQGTGLGLSLSYDIVKAHGGDILVASEEGEGTEFTIKLPAE
jgi:signal transduction histidine kinase